MTKKPLTFPPSGWTLRGFVTPVLIAQTTAPQATGGGYSSFLFLGVMLVVFYFLILRPQRSRAKAQKNLTSSLEIGDRIQSIGGIRGVIRSMDDDSVVIEVEQGKIRLARRAVASKIDSTG
jgi:preprotein translocase subunit YajC